MVKIKKFFKGFKQGTTAFGENIIVLINSILLLAVYILGVGLTSIVALVVGKDFLETKLHKEKSYWTDLKLKKKKTEEYYRQF